MRRLFLLLSLLFFLPSICSGWSANPWNNQCNCETINYSEYSIEDWAFRSEFATCGNIFDAINDSAIDFNDLPIEENIGAGDWLLLKKSDNTTSKVDALVFQSEMQNTPADFGDSTTIVNPEDNFAAIYNDTTFPHTFIFTPGTHTWNISGIVNLNEATFIGLGKECCTFIIDCNPTIGNYIRLAGAITFKDLSVQFYSVTGSNPEFWVVQEDNDISLKFINSEVVRKNGSSNAVNFLRTYNSAVNTALHFINSTISLVYTGHLVQPAASTDCSALAIYCSDSTITGKINFNSSMGNSLISHNSIFKSEVTFSRISEMISQSYEIYNTYFLTSPVYVERAFISLFDNMYMFVGGSSNSVMPFTTGDPIKKSLTQYCDCLRNYISTVSAYDNQIYTFSFDVKCEETNPTLSLMGYPCIIKLYLTEDSNDVRIQTGFDGSGDPIYTMALAGSLSIIEEIPCTTTFPMFPSSGDDLKVYRRITTW